MRLQDMIFDTRIQVGLQAQIAPERQHGLVSMRNEQGVLVEFGLVVDKPERLLKHDPDVIDEVFTQMLAFGPNPVNLEIKLNKERRVYAYGQTVPLLIQPMN